MTQDEYLKAVEAIREQGELIATTHPDPRRMSLRTVAAFENFQGHHREVIRFGVGSVRRV